MNELVIQRLKEIRKQENLTQEEFAKKLEVSRSYIAGVERGVREINTQMLKNLKDKFAVSSDWLLFGEETTGNTEENFKLAFTLNSADKIIVKSLESIFELLQRSKDEHDRNGAELMKELSFTNNLDNSLDLFSKLDDLHQHILKELYVMKKEEKEIAGIVRFYNDHAIKAHNYISETTITFHEMLYGKEAFSED
ncbi:MAG: helix-turn-helix transcriptional regulator [Marinifilum sp.]|jgi:transcriptional regulator with XRE-family HTH domain|nr:helix-turn-helix transcriptional regulator [Marinifilum sp.]